MTAFGVQLPNFSGIESDHLFEHVVGLAMAAETSGFDSVWVMDHYFQLPPLGGPDEPMMEAYTLLGGLAARTSRVQLGTLVTGVTYRNPGILAKIVTTLDVISRGGPSWGSAGRGTTSSTRASASTTRPTGSAWTCWPKRSRSAGPCSPAMT